MPIILLSSSRHILVAVTMVMVVMLWLVLVEGLQVLVRAVIVFVVKLDIELSDSHRTEDHLGVADHILRITVLQDLELEATNIIIAAQCPESRLLDTLYSLKLQDLEYNTISVRA